MKHVFSYVVLSIYWSVALSVFLLCIGGGISTIHYISDGIFIFPENQIKRAIAFGCICGIAITVITLVYRLIDKFKTRKSPPSDHG
ncbi:hypothetical protein BZP36_09540 [Raoultella terrigena]|nr:hypothetical protein BZP36_09540 [Raoultella terrigena]